MKDKRLVYTVILGGYDLLHELEFKSNNVDYICVTDDPKLLSNSWDILLIPPPVNPVETNRRYKLFPFEFFNYEESIYVDGNLSIKGDVNFIFDKYMGKSDIAISKHPFRTCIYDEAAVCLSVGKVSEIQVRKQMQKYTYSNFPKNYGLFENNVIIRKHSRDIAHLMEEWWTEFNLHTKRDQLSFCYVLWKNRMECTAFEEGPRYSSKYFSFQLHKKELSLPLIKRMAAIIILRQKQNVLYFMASWIVKNIKSLMSLTK